MLCLRCVHFAALYNHPIVVSVSLIPAENALTLTCNHKMEDQVVMVYFYIFMPHICSHHRVGSRTPRYNT